MSARFPPAVACVRISCLFKAEKHSTVCIYHIWFVHSSYHGNKLLPFSYHDKSCCEHGNTYYLSELLLSIFLSTYPTAGSLEGLVLKARPLKRKGTHTKHQDAGGIGKRLFGKQGPSPVKEPGQWGSILSLLRYCS